MKKFVGKRFKYLKVFQRNYNISNTKYLEDIELKWNQDHKSVDPSWNDYFSKLDSEITTYLKTMPNLKQDGSMPLELKTSIQAFVNSHQTKGHNIAGN